MADKFVYIPNDDTQNFPFCRLIVVQMLGHTLKPTYKNSIKVPKVDKPMNKAVL